MDLTAMTEVATVSDHHEPGEETRRDFLYLSAGAMAAVGAGAALWPLIASMNPAAEILALSSIEADPGPIEPGQRITVKWRGQPVFIDHRTPGQIAAARADDDAVLPDPELDTTGVLRPEGLVVIGICTHFGCVPLEQEPAIRRGNGTAGSAPCHGSHYDASGRVRKSPAPRNLVVPPYAIPRRETHSGWLRIKACPFTGLERAERHWKEGVLVQ